MMLIVGIALLVAGIAGGALVFALVRVSGQADDEAERLAAELMGEDRPRRGLKCIECGTVFANRELGVYSAPRTGFRCRDCYIVPIRGRLAEEIDRDLAEASRT